MIYKITTHRYVNIRLVRAYSKQLKCVLHSDNRGITGFKNKTKKKQTKLSQKFLILTRFNSQSNQIKSNQYWRRYVPPHLLPNGFRPKFSKVKTSVIHSIAKRLKNIKISMFL